MKEPAKKKTTKRKAIPPGLRYQVLIRANCRCEACGVPASRARLEIDHKIPVSLGGQTTLKNLQVLCLTCNRGKGAKPPKRSPVIKVSPKTKLKAKAVRSKGDQPSKSP